MAASGPTDQPLGGPHEVLAKDRNIVSLKKAEWNVLVDVIKSGKVGKLDHEACKARTGPLGLGRPCGQLTEERIDYLFRPARKLNAKCLECGECPFVL